MEKLFVTAKHLINFMPFLCTAKQMQDPVFWPFAHFSVFSQT